MEKCIAAARTAYESKHAPENLGVIIQKHAGHQVLPESEQAAIEWFVQWLKP